MIRRLIRWKKTALAMAVLFMALNGLAYMHARAFTHFTTGGKETEAADKLSWEEKARVLFTGPTMPRPEIKRRPAFWTSYDTCTFPSTDGVELEAWHIPCADSPAIVVMFHGYGASKSSLLDEAKAFRSLGCSTLLVDFRGSGGSSGAVTTLGYEEADDVAAAVAQARKLEPGKFVILYGSSMGSVAVLRAMAVRGVEPAAAVLECPFDSMLSTVKNRFDMMGVPAFPAAYMLVFWGGLQFGFNGFAHDTTDYAAKIKCPVLLINGDKDRRVTVNQIRAVYTRLAGPKRLEIFEGVGHGGYLDHDPRRWRRVVKELIDKSGLQPFSRESGKIQG